MLDWVNLYAVSVASIFAVLVIGWVSRCASPYIPRLRFWALNCIYPLLIRRRKWTSVTYIEFVLLGAYISMNGICMGLGTHGTSDRMLRSGLMSSINTVPLFLGGRTNVLVDGFGIPLHTYYLAHHWVGRMAVMQVLLHVGLAISSRQWTLDTVTISGVVVGLSYGVQLLQH
jgi:hypothetical protein